MNLFDVVAGDIARRRDPSRRKPPVLLNSGDVSEVEGLGTLINTFIVPE